MTIKTHPSMSGKRYGRWTVVIDQISDGYRNKYCWCRCDCGTYRLVYRHGVYNGRSTSCGCLSSELARERIKALHKSGSDNHNWLGGIANHGSVAFANGILQRARHTARKAGYAPPAISGESLSDIFTQHDGRCDICDQSDVTIVVDHDHESGSFRGLICRECNLGLGHFKDSIDAIEKAAGYLRHSIKGREQ